MFLNFEAGWRELGVRTDAARICAPPRGDRGSSLIVDVDGVFSERRRFATRARITPPPLARAAAAPGGEVVVAVFLNFEAGWRELGVRTDAARICAPPRGDRGSSLIVDVDGVFSERRRFATRARITLTPGRPKSARKPVGFWALFRCAHL